MPVNLELKASVPSLERMSEVAQKAGALFKGILHQRDTYFTVQHGRLKLREIRGEAAELVYYERREDDLERWSRYERIPVSDPLRLREALEKALGVRGVVTKERHLYMHEAARIHLDRVEVLGTFIEFEVPEEGGGENAVVRMDYLRSTFGIEDRQIIRASYCDLIVRKTAGFPA